MSNGKLPAANMSDRPIAIDLYCGRGGWAHGFIAHGYRVIGFDVFDFAGIFPGEFHQHDCRTLDGQKFRNAAVILASSPCDEFSRFAMPWTRKRNPPWPALGIELAEAAVRIAKEAARPLVLENVRTAQQFIGPAQTHCGPFYLWGDVPALIPDSVLMKKKESYGSKDKAKRAEIPFALAHWIAGMNWRDCRPSGRL